jgi:hypothetical protein
MDAINSLQQVVPWLTGLPVSQKVIATIVIVAPVVLLLMIIWTPLPDSAVSTILSKCHSRALFTRMHAQLDQEAMFASIGKCLATINEQKQQIRSKDLQKEAVNLLAAVEGIERVKEERNTDPATRINNINKLKVAALHSFRKLANATNGSYILPGNNELAEAVYFTQAEADAPLNIADLKNLLSINPTTGETIPSSKN